MLKVYSSLDFSTAPARIEPNVPGDYIVQDEDFEDINDLVARATRTRSKLPDMSSDMAEYDEKDVFVEDIKNEYNISEEDNNLSQNAAEKPSDEVPSGKRSDAAGTLPDGDENASVTP